MTWFWWILVVILAGVFWNLNYRRFEAGRVRWLNCLIVIPCAAFTLAWLITVYLFVLILVPVCGVYYFIRFTAQFGSTRRAAKEMWLACREAMKRI